jgi:hypothetical protein
MNDGAYSRQYWSRVAFPTLVLLLASGPVVAEPGGTAASTGDTSDLILASPAAVKPVTPAEAPGAAAKPPSLGLDISAVMPSYQPERPAGGSPADADLRTIDKPRNQIPRLPAAMMQKYVVRASRVPVFRTRDLLSKEGLIDLAFKEHPGLRFGNFFNLNAAAAYDRAIREQLAASRQDLVDDTFALAAGGEPDEEAVMQQDILDASFANQTPGGPVGIK